MHVTRLPFNRSLTTDVGYFGRRRHSVYTLLEVDLTETRSHLKRIRDAGNSPASLNAWIVARVAQAAAEYPDVHAVRKGRKLYSFNEVDVAVMVEREVDREKVPLPFLIRNAHKKSASEISLEIQGAKRQEIAPGKPALYRHVSARLAALFERMPALVRRLVFWWILRSPKLVKKLMGTVVVTSPGNLSGTPAWSVPMTFTPLCVAVGSITRKPGISGDRIEPRDILHLTILFDHDVVDGAPAARFISRLIKLLEKPN